jgi:hypothetical protein
LGVLFGKNFDAELAAEIFKVKFFLLDMDIEHFLNHLELWVVLTLFNVDIDVVNFVL